MSIDFVETVTRWAYLGGYLLLVPANLFSVFVLVKLAGRRIALLTPLWLFMGALFSTLSVCAHGLIDLGAEPVGTMMGLGFAQVPAILSVHPWVVLLSVLALIKGDLWLRIMLVVWWVLIAARLTGRPGISDGVRRGVLRQRRERGRGAALAGRPPALVRPASGAGSRP